MVALSFMPAYICKEASLLSVGSSSCLTAVDSLSFLRVCLFSCLDVVVFVVPPSFERQGQVSTLISAFASSVSVLLEVLGGVFVAGHDVEGVAVDLDVAADGHVRHDDELVVVVHVLVLLAVQELALDDA